MLPLKIGRSNDRTASVDHHNIDLHLWIPQDVHRNFPGVVRDARRKRSCPSIRAQQQFVSRRAVGGALHDLAVSAQRLTAEGMLSVPERFNVYLNMDDKAIGLSGWLFNSVTRLGQLAFSFLTPRSVILLSKLDDVDFVEVKVETGFIGHNYFYSHPAVSSDLILLLSEGVEPGEVRDDGMARPLKLLGGRYWQLTKNYPQPVEPAE